MRFGRELETVGDAVHMGIHRNAIDDSVTDVQNDVGRLAPHTRKLDELLHLVGNHTAVIGHDHLRARDAVLGLGLVKAERLDDVGKLLVCRPGHLLSTAMPSTIP